MPRFPRRDLLRAGLAPFLPRIAGAADAGAGAAPGPRGTATPERVREAIRDGIGFLKSQQQKDGSWPGLKDQHQPPAGTTALVAHALLTAGEPPDAPHVAAALAWLGRLTPDEIDGTYSVALWTMAFAESDPDRHRLRIAAGVDWLRRAQVKEGDASPGWPGMWAHTSDKRRPADNSSTQFALLGLHTAAQAGVQVDPELWLRARNALEHSQADDGGWPYYPNTVGYGSSASMTCAGISGLVISGHRLARSRELFVGDEVRGCGEKGINPAILRGLAWLTTNFTVAHNPGSSFHLQWKYYYLYGLERASRLTGLRAFGGRDWYREGAEELLSAQDPVLGSWAGEILERQPLLATSLAILFLATARAPLLVNKLRHGPGDDWNNDIDDMRNLVEMISSEWKMRLAWQVADPESASVEGLLQAPIAYFNGHEPPEFGPKGEANLRRYVEQGGFLLAEACCGEHREGFDRGFRDLMKRLFPEPEYALRAVGPDHEIWRSAHQLDPNSHPLWSIELGCRTGVLYTPRDLSCGWNQMEVAPAHPRVIAAARLGQNIVDYVTGRQPPADKLTAHEIREYTPEPPRRGLLKIAKLRFDGDWNAAPLAIPRLAAALRNPPLGFDASLGHYELLPEDPGLIHFPLVYIHGRSAIRLRDDQLVPLRRHLDPGGGTLFADAACNNPAFDASFREMLAVLLPISPLVPIPPDDDLYSEKTGYDLRDCRYSEAVGGGRGFPRLEGIKINGRWAVIYSKIDIGCALEGRPGMNFKGYDPESALKIAVNVVIYSSLP